MKIEKVFLETRNIKATKEFYASSLGLPVKTIAESRIAVSIGSSKLIFSPAGDANPFYHFAINIPVNKIDEARQWALKRTQLLWIEDHKSEIAEFVNWEARSIYFLDATGNIVELIARMPLHNDTDEEFSAKQFLCIDEVGLVFRKNELEAGVQSLLEKFHLDYFKRQPPLPHFQAIGDDRGLFIAVPEGRNWYPTDKSCAIFPLAIEFRENNILYKSELQSTDPI